MLLLCYKPTSRQSWLVQCCRSVLTQVGSFQNHFRFFQSCFWLSLFPGLRGSYDFFSCRLTVVNPNMSLLFNSCPSFSLFSLFREPTLFCLFVPLRVTPLLLMLMTSFWPAFGGICWCHCCCRSCCCCCRSCSCCCFPSHA